MTAGGRVRALGVNHVALEVDSVDAALEWWLGSLTLSCPVTDRGRHGVTSATSSSRSASRALSRPTRTATFGLVVVDAIITSSSKNVTPTNVETALRERLGILVVATDPAAVASAERVYQALQAEVDGVNRRYARIEQVHDLTQATEELKPTIKVKRDVVYDRHGETLERLYA